MSEVNAVATMKLGKLHQKLLNAKLIILALFVVLLGAAQVASHGTFFEVQNILNILAQNSISGSLAVGQTMVILSSGIDLSLGSVTALSSIVAAMLQDHGPLIARSAALGVGLACGLINGMVIVFGRVPPFIATLGMMQAALGVSYVVSNGYPIYEKEHVALAFGLDKLGAVPMIAVLWFLVAVVAWILLRFTRFGAYVYAIGGNERTALTSGVSVARTKLFIYAFSGLCAAIGGIISINRLGYTQPTLGASYTLDSIAPVVLGGTSLFGGVGGVWYTMLGVMVAGTLNNLMVLLGVNIYIVQIVQGVIILSFVFLFIRFQKR
jgi:inositol transport system permease protein